MADKETGLNITVGAVADENSAAQAAKDLTKGVLSSLKDGYIEVPAEIKVPIKGASKELEQAQKKVLTQWRKTFKKGFSSSEEDLSELTKAYKKFKELSKGKAKEEQSKWITNVIGKQIASYKRQLAKQSRPVEKTTTTRTKNPRNFGESSRTNTKKTKRDPRYEGLRSTGPAGYGNGWVDKSKTNDYDSKMSEISSHPSEQARQTRRSEKESQKWMKESLNITKPGAEAIEQAIIDARKNGNNKNQFSPEEKALGLSDDIRKNLLPELINKIKKSEDDAEITKLSKEFFDTLTAISNLNIEAGKLILSDVNKTLGITMGTLGFTTSGNIGGTEGDKEDLSKDPKMQSLLKGLLNKVAEKEDDILQQTIKLEQLEKTSGTKTKIEKAINSFANKVIANAGMNNATQIQNSKEVVQAVNQNQKAVETNTSYDKIENSAERVADSMSGKKTDSLIKDAEEDLGSGFNTDSSADNVISTLQAILSEVQSITKNGLNVVGLQKGQTNTRSNPSLLPVPAQPEMQQALKNFEYVKKYGKSQAVSGDIPSSTISTTVKDPHSWVTKLKDAFAELTNTTANYKVIMAKTSEEQNKMSADRIRKYGISRGNGPTDTGDKTMIARRLSLFRNKDYFKTLFKDINLSEGIKIDTTDVTDKLAKALSGKEMFNAQTGGWLKNILGAMTGGVAFAFQPSLEKSRSRAEGVNQIMSNIRKVLNDTVQDIQDKESKLRGMKASGDLKLDAKGNVLESSSTEAKTLVLQLQESKDVLNSILADTKYVDEVVSRTHGRIGGMIKQLGFTSPVLRKNNAILANLNAGLDKGGKALKYQTRMAELLGYSFRLIARHVGQTFKNLILNVVSFLNPLTHIKKAFQDFMGYNTKWQRTMNVIKYNLRAILQPFMDKVAQFLVNCIGFIDIISMKVQEAFGNVPVSLFDQAAADAEKMKEELEAAANVTAGFDELHDIGSDNTGANDLFGDIYKPQLSQEWIDLANEIGDLFAGLIKGDLGFGDVVDFIWKKLQELGQKIWDWFKNTSLGKWIIENWQHLLWTLLNIFIAWKLFKIIGPMLLNAFTGWLTKGAAGSLFTGLGTKISGFLSKGLYTGMNGATVTMGKFLGGIALVGGGIALAGTQAAKAGKNWQDYNGWQKAGAVGAVGLGSAMAGLGAVMLGASGPVGWAVAGATALGSLVIGMSQTQNGMKSLKEETEEWQQVNEQLQQALMNVETTNQNYAIALADIKQLEQETGESGEDLANAVDSGQRSVKDLTVAELKLYNAYKTGQKIIQDQIDARQQAYKLAQKESKEKADILAQQGKETKSYDELREHIVKCWENGTMSAEDARDKISRYLVDMDLQSRITFIENLPANLREGLDPGKYESVMTKLGNWMNEKFGKFGDGLKSIFGIATNELENFAHTSEELKIAEDNLAAAHANVEDKTNILNEAEQKAGMTFDELNQKIKDGKIEYNKLTDAQKAVVDAHNALETAQAEERASLTETGKAVAGVAYEAYKSSGDYKQFIETMKKANEDGKISTQDMNKYFGEVMSDMDTHQREMFTNYMKELGLSTKESEQFCKQTEGLFQSWVNGIKGFFSDLWTNIGGFFSRVGQRFGNLFSGNGFKTDSEVQNTQALQNAGEEKFAKVIQEHPEDFWDLIKGKKNINSYAVGTNYVPNDGLAYLHQGEAVIPKKYNTPYQSPNMSGLENSINNLNAQVSQISQIVSQGIDVRGQFVQRGTDLVASIEKTNSKLSNSILNNKVYAR